MMNGKEILKKSQGMLGLTQKELGVYIGVSTRTVNSWMTDERKCPDYVVEMTARLAAVDAEALENGDPTTGMMRWAVISSDGGDEFLTVCGSKADALREAETDWNHMTQREKEKAERFEVGLIHVCLAEEHASESRFSSFVRDDGTIDADVYECAKDYLQK